MIYLRQSTASQEIMLGTFVDETDGFTAETALVIANTDIKVWKAGAAVLANKNSGGATHVAAGRYTATLDATDTDTLGSGTIFVHVAGARPINLDFTVLPANVYDSLILGSDLLDVNTAQWLGTACATPTVAGVPEVDLTHVAGATTNVAALATNVDAILVDTGTTLQAEIDAIQADVEDLQARTPAALVSGRMDASVGAMAANVVTASAIAANAIGAAEVNTDLLAAIADANWDELRAGHVVSGSFGETFVAIHAGAITSSPSTTSFADTSLTSTQNNNYIGRLVIFTTGTLAKQAATITGFNPDNDTLYFSLLSAVPTIGDQYIIV